MKRQSSIKLTKGRSGKFRNSILGEIGRTFDVISKAVLISLWEQTNHLFFIFVKIVQEILSRCVRTVAN